MRYLPVLIALSTVTPSFAQELKLPLTLGYYVETGTACADANEANTAYLHEKGLNNSFGMCEFTGLSDGGDGTWAYAAICGGGEELGEIESQGQITIKSETAFNIANGAQELDYSFCPNDQLSAQFLTP